MVNTAISPAINLSRCSIKNAESDLLMNTVVTTTVIQPIKIIRMPMVIALLWPAPGRCSLGFIINYFSSRVFLKCQSRLYRFGLKISKSNMWKTASVLIMPKYRLITHFIIYVDNSGESVYPSGIDGIRMVSDENILAFAYDYLQRHGSGGFVSPLDEHRLRRLLERVLQ
jgi:hypothetical protein